MPMTTWSVAIVALVVVSTIAIALFCRKWNQTDMTEEQGQKRISDMKFLGITWLLFFVVIVAACTGAEYLQ